MVNPITTSRLPVRIELNAPTEPLARVRGLRFFYGAVEALQNVDLDIAAGRVTALIGPSGCGKTTLLRCFNRMHELQPGTRFEGKILLEPSGVNILDRHVDPIAIRMRIGMVFQKPNCFPKSIFENVAYGLRVRGVRKRAILAEKVEQALSAAALWDETKDRLNESALRLSGGQQQRLCIARALAVEPQILLFDEPTSALDPIATARIEQLIGELRGRVTIVIVTHNMHQANRVSDFTAFMYLGKLIEMDATDRMFTAPAETLTQRYLGGHFG